MKLEPKGGVNISNNNEAVRIARRLTDPEILVDIVQMRRDFGERFDSVVSEEEEKFSLDEMLIIDRSSVLNIIARESECEELLTAENLRKLEGITIQEVMIALINVGKESLVVEKLEEVEILDDLIARNLIEEGYASVVCDSFKIRERCSSRLAVSLIERGFINEIDCSKCVVGKDPFWDNELARNILFRGNPASKTWLIENIKDFVLVDEGVVLALCNEEGYETVLELLEMGVHGPVGAIDDFKVAMRLVENGLNHVMLEEGRWVKYRGFAIVKDFARETMWRVEEK